MKKFLVVFSVFFVSSVFSVNEVSAQSMRLAYQAQTAGKTDFQVFNRDGGLGFVVVAASDVTDGNELVLAYADKGEFDYQALPDGARFMLEEYQRQIEWMRAHGIKSSRAQELKLSGPKTGSIGIGRIVVPPLLGDNAWGQQAPFNAMCPKVGSEQCVVGCVATSMSQVMSYWNWPLQGKGSRSYKWNDQTLSSTFSEHTYRWDLIRPYYDSSITNNEKNAIAQLSSDCGISVKMGYGTDQSGAYSSDIATALKAYFSYSVTQFVYRQSYGSDWDTKLISELDSKRPVLYGGAGDDGGHAFVCDGYSENKYFHFNFGWRGLGNGYFLSSACGDSEYESGFTTQQSAVFGAKPSGSYRNAVSGIYYVKLGGDEAGVVAPEVKEYDGDITIPSTVTISDVEYSVTTLSPSAFTNSAVASVSLPASLGRIESYTFYNCPNLKDVYVSWTDPLDIRPAVFGAEVYAGATLHVPAGTLDKYRTAAAWCLFTTITDGTDTMAWDAWTPAKNGVCNYTYSLKQAYPRTENLPVYIRSSKSDPNTQQLRVEQWGADATLIIDVDAATGDCQLAQQTTGFFNGTDEVFVSDMPHYKSSSYTYKRYPCTFDTETGELSLRVAYFTPNTGGYYASGTDRMKISGYADYTISIETVQCDGVGNVSGTVNLGADVPKYSYVIRKGSVSDSEIETIVSQVSSGELVPAYATGTTFTDKVDVPGTYTLVVMSYTVAGKVKYHESAQFKYISSMEPDWAERYIGTYTYSIWENEVVNNVSVYQDLNNPTSWKLSPMYDGSEFFFSMDDNLIEFDQQTTPFIYKKLEVYVEDLHMADNTQKQSYYSPSDKTFYFNTLYTGYNGKFTEKGFETFVWKNPGTGIENAGNVGNAGNAENRYDLVGRLVGSGYKGIVIQRGRKYLNR